MTFATPAKAAERPHIVVILADDLGWGDLQCYNDDSKIPTPNFDRVASEGVRFTNAHTPSSVCTPTRYSLLTGRYCWRTSLKKGVLDGFDPPLIGPDETTIAGLLNARGYRTACVGKWHLGMNWHDRSGNPIPLRTEGRHRSGDEADFARELGGGPLDCGFDSYFGISASLDMSPYVFIRDRRAETVPTERHEELEDTLFLAGVSGPKAAGFRMEDVLPALGDEAVKIISGHDPDKAPLFLYLPLTSPHLPVAPSTMAKGKSEAGEYGDFVWETDHVVGRVVDTLAKKGMSENTLLIVTSDNGGLWHSWDFRADDDGGAPPKTPRGQYTAGFGHHSNAGWRGTKADVYEGGHRVPFLVRWPAKAKAGQVTEALVEVTDIFATVAEITGAGPGPGTSGMDSLSFLATLTDPQKPGRAFAVHHSLNGTFCIRTDGWKLIEGRGSGGFTRPNNGNGFKDGLPGQLYDLSSDARETTNRWKEEPERVASMTALLDRVRGSSAREVAGR
ncbi:MAG: arylsulfatase [Verrucomicrobiae bacterium]|nr:arylsulfatase [Verrucomicrobiae bacterium]